MRRFFATILLIIIIICNSYATAERISYDEAIRYEYREHDKNDNIMYGYNGVWFVSPSSGIEVYIPEDWLEIRQVKGYRTDSISYIACSYDERYHVSFQLNYCAAKNAAEQLEYMDKHNMYSNRTLIPFGDIELIAYTKTNSTYDWNMCLEHVPGNGFSYSFCIKGSNYETMEEEDLIESLINSYTIRIMT